MVTIKKDERGWLNFCGVSNNIYFLTDAWFLHLNRRLCLLLIVCVLPGIILGKNTVADMYLATVYYLGVVKNRFFLEL